MRLLCSLIVGCLLPFAANAADEEMCRQPELLGLPAEHPECLYYSGNASFRRRDFVEAGRLWQVLVDKPNVPQEFERVKSSAHNNLGYLYFFGWGIAPNRAKAIDLWLYAAAHGHEESSYHLCHVFGDEANSEYAPARALGFCKESLRQYSLLKAPEASTVWVVNELRGYIARLGLHLSTRRDTV